MAKKVSKDGVVTFDPPEPTGIPGIYCVCIITGEAARKLDRDLSERIEKALEPNRRWRAESMAHARDIILD
ncbi:MAG: hypothetical protein UT66_C0028G0007 [candidate division CPR2 bacterium GW2011_GWC1_39_9]|uniref:Uncharacterized protein n=1 Tax=candidate division CPR2 bacterium GW2011_GWC2_39_10 TaxID=1618345 RepID=A0A0G0PZD8_UNCC2|nr:MAG: hypothetical protein UT18_C0007G0032 [candidate division CPR2 bacterium GW2011_GWC2_39_10]KKR34116.1 MAG: hypothetical protein UT66_C0028G0007 [candidate division CPR2 bacterium GW2011_GWC1_39_9]